MTKHLKWIKHRARARRYKKPSYWQRHNLGSAFTRFPYMGKRHFGMAATKFVINGGGDWSVGIPSTHAEVTVKDNIRGKKGVDSEHEKGDIKTFKEMLAEFYDVRPEEVATEKEAKKRDATETKAFAEMEWERLQDEGIKRGLTIPERKEYETLKIEEYSRFPQEKKDRYWELNKRRVFDEIKQELSKPLSWQKDNKSYSYAPFRMRHGKYTFGARGGKLPAEAIPTHKMLVGHTNREDIYDTPTGELFAYSGHKKMHWDNPKYWEKISDEVSSKKRQYSSNPKRFWVGVSTPWPGRRRMWDVAENKDFLSPDLLAKAGSIETPLLQIEAKNEDEAVKKYKEEVPEVKDWKLWKGWKPA